MARPRTPKAKAVVTGQSEKKRTKFEARHEPLVDEGVGEPFHWLNDNAKAAWKEIASEVTWLNRSHRGHLAIAASIRGRMISGEDIGVQAMNLLRQCYGQMGATPADMHKIQRPAAAADPASQYFT